MRLAYPAPEVHRDGGVVRKLPEVVPPLAAAAATLVASLSLIGWHFRIPALREPPGGFMAPNAALSFLLLSTSIVLLHWRTRRWAQWIGMLCAALVISFAGVMTFEYVTNIDTGAARMFFHHRLSDWNLPGPPGRYAPNSGITFILYGISILFIYRDRNRSFAQSLTGFGLVIGSLAFIGHIYGVEALYSVETSTYMASVTALCFVFLGFGTLFSVARGGWMGVVLRDDAAGLLSRRILLITYLVYPVIGYVVIVGERKGIISSAFSTSMLVVTALVLITSTVFRTAREIRRLDHARRVVQDRLRDAEKLAATGRLAATLAHEVNNPLEAVTNILYLLKHDPGLNQQSMEFLKLAEGELTRVTHITRQTLAFYREPMNPVPVKLGELVSQVVSVFQPKLQDKGLSVRVESRFEDEVVMFPGELKQVVTNLLSNAIDACDPMGKIVIRVSGCPNRKVQGDSGFRITVADNGVGISDDGRRQLFQPFFTTKGQKGTGLGLWVTHGLIAKHGGTLHVRSNTKGAHRGTSFSLCVPAALERRKMVQGDETPGRQVSQSAAS